MHEVGAWQRLSGTLGRNKGLETQQHMCASTLENGRGRGHVAGDTEGT